ncbi:hypothetical protein OPIT5_04710 [Opitutaceae bacterium TAV5]|nr:hypothetical protein OPIT5_04710 [Opitutaceae bacterium TAV5]
MAPGTEDWTNPASWDGGAAPGPWDVAEILNGGTSRIGNDVTAVAGALDIGAGASGSGAVVISGANARLEVQWETRLGGGGGTGLIDVSGGGVASLASLHAGPGGTSILRIGGAGSQVNAGAVNLETVADITVRDEGAMSVSGEFGMHGGGSLLVHGAGSVLRTGEFAYALGPGGTPAGEAAVRVADGGTLALAGGAGGAVGGIRIGETGGKHTDATLLLVEGENSRIAIGRDESSPLGSHYSLRLYQGVTRIAGGGGITAKADEGVYAGGIDVLGSARFFVDGTGSFADVGNLSVGDHAIARISGGASLRSWTYGSIYGNGRVEITDTGTLFSSDGLVMQGGELVLSGGAGMNTGLDGGTGTRGIHIGTLAGPVARARAEGAGTLWESVGPVHVGKDGGEGILEISDGARVVFGQDDSLSPDRSFFSAGASGTGRVDISGGGVLETVGTASLGGIGNRQSIEGTQGALTVSGDKSEWRHAGGLYINRYSSLAVESGGTATISGGIRVNFDDTGDTRGRIAVRGAGSRLTVGSISLDGAGLDMDVTDGGRLAVDTSLGMHGESSLSVRGAGSTLTADTVTAAGRLLEIRAGATAELRELTVAGHLVVDGAGTRLDLLGPAETSANRSYLIISNEGARADGEAATAVFSGGARVSSADRQQYVPYVIAVPGIGTEAHLIGSYRAAAWIGAGADKDNPASLLVTGAGTSWTHEGSLYLRGQSEVTVSGGATVEVSHGTFVATESFHNEAASVETSNNVLTVDAGSRLRTAWVALGSGNANVVLRGTLEAGSIFRTATAADDIEGNLGKRTVLFDGATFRVTADGWRLGDGATPGETFGNDILYGRNFHSRINVNGFAHGELVLADGGLVIDTSEMAAIGEEVSISATFTGNGGLVKTGEGALRLVNGKSSRTVRHHDFTGGITVREGLLGLSDASMDPATVITLFSGATLELDFEGIMTVAALVVDGQSLAGGLWDAYNLSDYITGTGQLLVSPIPEPGSWAAFGGCLCLLFALARRLRRPAAPEVPGR